MIETDKLLTYKYDNRNDMTKLTAMKQGRTRGNVIGKRPQEMI